MQMDATADCADGGGAALPLVAGLGQGRLLSRDVPYRKTPVEERKPGGGNHIVDYQSITQMSAYSGASSRQQGIPRSQQRSIA